MNTFLLSRKRLGSVAQSLSISTCLLLIWAHGVPACAQTPESDATTAPGGPAQQTIQERITQLERELADLKASVKQNQDADGATPASSQNPAQDEDRKILDFLRETTIN